MVHWLLMKCLVNCILSFYFDLNNQPEDLYKAHKHAELEICYTIGGTTGVNVDHHMFILIKAERSLVMKRISGLLAIAL